MVEPIPVDGRSHGVCYRRVPIQQQLRSSACRAAIPVGEREYVVSMGRAIGSVASVTPWEAAAVLGWWCLILAVPVMLLRRRRRRRGKLPRCSLSGGGQRRISAIAASQNVHASLSEPPRLSPATVDPLCRYVDFHRRLRLAVSELDRALAVLPRDRWRIEPYPLTGERGNTLLVMGETGVFLISATYPPGHFDDVITVSRMARKIQHLLPGYPGQVQAAICFPFSSVRPRIWYRADDCGEWLGAWVLGGDSVIEWLAQFGPEHGLSPADLDQVDELSKPNWLTSAIPTPPSWPPLHRAARQDLE